MIGEGKISSEPKAHISIIKISSFVPERYKSSVESESSLMVGFKIILSSTFATLTALIDVEIFISEV